MHTDLYDDLLFPDEFQTHRVDAIALAGGLRTIIEHVAQVRSASAACGLGAHHAKGLVLMVGDSLLPLRLASRRMISPVLGMLREVCGEFGILTDREQLSVSIALEEAMANAIVHGNLEVSSKLRDLEDDSFERLIAFRLEKTPFGQRRVEIVAKFTEREVSFTIADQGPGFDVNAIPDPTDDDNVMLSHGRGLFLMRSFMDEVFHNAAGNQVTLIKRKVGQG